VDVRFLAHLARLEITILFACFGAVTLWKLFQTGCFSGLLRSDDGSLSPGRIQLLVLTVLTALQYLLMVLHDPSHLPPISSGLVMGLGGSQSIYLGAKAWGVFGKRDNVEDK
jgi:hypothetical protein